MLRKCSFLKILCIEDLFIFYDQYLKDLFNARKKKSVILKIIFTFYSKKNILFGINIARQKNGNDILYICGNNIPKKLKEDDGWVIYI